MCRRVTQPRHDTVTGTHRERIAWTGRITCGDSDIQTRRRMGGENEGGKE